MAEAEERDDPPPLQKRCSVLSEFGVPDAQPPPVNHVGALVGTRGYGWMVGGALAVWLLQRRVRRRGGFRSTVLDVAFCLLSGQAALRLMKSEVLVNLMNVNHTDERFWALLHHELDSKWSTLIVGYVTVWYGLTRAGIPVDVHALSPEQLSLFVTSNAVLAWRVARVGSGLARLTIESQVKEEHALAVRPFVNMSRGLMAGVGVLWVSSRAGLDVRSLMTGLGISGIALAWGVQALVQDITSAFGILVLAQPFQVGSCVCVDGVWGMVEGIYLKSTAVRDFDGNLHIIPNSKVMNCTVVNGKNGTWRRGSLYIELSAQTSPAQLEGFQDVVKAAIEAPTKARRCEFGICRMTITDMGYSWRTTFYVNDPHGVDAQDIMDLESVCLVEAVRALREGGYQLANIDRAEAPRVLYGA